MGAQVSVRSSNRCQRVTWGKRRRMTASISFQRNVWEFSCQSQDESRKSRTKSRGYVLGRGSHVSVALQMSPREVGVDSKRKRIFSFAGVVEVGLVLGLVTPCVGCRRRPSHSFGECRVMVGHRTEGGGSACACRQKPSHSFGEWRVAPWALGATAPRSTQTPRTTLGAGTPAPPRTSTIPLPLARVWGHAIAQSPYVHVGNAVTSTTLVGS